MANEHVDRDVLDTLREVMEDGYPDLLDTFLSDSEKRLRELREAADAKALSAIAHSLKGSASNMGAVRLVQLCQELESDAQSKSPAEIVKLVTDISYEFADVRPVYENEKQHAHTH